jgi:hypothetical protein
MTTAKRAPLGQPPLDGREFRRLMDGQLKEAPWQVQVCKLADMYEDLKRYDLAAQSLDTLLDLLVSELKKVV